jgi:ABC-2 type transport system ATP-binding protein
VTVNGEPAVRTTGLTKRWRSGQVAVKDLDLEVPRGSVYGFLGPNGSGKTTTIRMLLGLINATDGEISVLGQPVPGAVAQILPRVGALIEGPAFQPYLSGRANLHRLDRWDASSDPRSSAARIDAVLERVGLRSAENKRYRNYSLGMKQRLGIAAALLQPRELLILDEPTNGLDPQGTREIRTLVRDLAEDGTTVLVSSHLLSEVEQICSHIGVMRAGSLVAQGLLDEVRRQAGPQEIRIKTPDVEIALRVLRARGLNPRMTKPQEVTSDVGSDPVEAVSAALAQADVAIRGFRVVRADLEDLFVSLTGEGFDVAG